MLTLFCRADATPPITYIGSVSSGVQFGAPQACMNPDLEAPLFDIYTSEAFAFLECRLSRWSSAYEDFDGNVESWQPTVVQRWLRDDKHVRVVGFNLSVVAPLPDNTTGTMLLGLDDDMLRGPPFSIDPGLTSSPRRAALLLAIKRQQHSFTACQIMSTTEPRTAATILLEASDLRHGRALLEVRAIDTAGNVGLSAPFIWFIGSSRTTAKSSKYVDPLTLVSSFHGFHCFLPGSTLADRSPPLASWTGPVPHTRFI